MPAGLSNERLRENPESKHDEDLNSFIRTKAKLGNDSMIFKRADRDSPHEPCGFQIKKRLQDVATFICQP